MSGKDPVAWNPSLTNDEEQQVAGYMADARRAAPLMRALREHLGLTQEEFAALLGVTQSNVSKMEARPEPHWPALRKLVERKGGRLKLVVEIGGRELEWPFDPAA